MKQKRIVSITILSLLYVSVLPSDTQLTVPISIGELIDKITILEIKSGTIKNLDKLANIRTEMGALLDILEQHITHTGTLADLTAELLRTNKKLWDIEDAIREKEAKKEFDDEFIAIARSVYFTNDYRGKLKHDINLLTESCLVEEKQYTEYQ